MSAGFAPIPSWPIILIRFNNSATELADRSLGRFIFVFSPSDKLTAISGKLSRATVVSVGGLTEHQALDYLHQIGCNASHAAAVHELVDGHLPYLIKEPVRAFCLGETSLFELESHFTSEVRSILYKIDTDLNCGEEDGCTCKAACAVRNHVKFLDPWKLAVPQLVNTHLVRASLMNGLTIDSRFVLCFIERHCACSVKSRFAVSPPCAFVSSSN